MNQQPFLGIRIGFALTGSFCTLSKVVPQITQLREEGAIITPILSFSVRDYNTRFGDRNYWRDQVSRAAATIEIIDTIAGAEPIGPRALLDIMVIAPCSGNSLAKLAAGIADTPVLMAAKAHLRNNRPLVIAVSSNDALAANFSNIGTLLNRKQLYFVPFVQDDTELKPNSLIADWQLLAPTIAAALKGHQLQPIFCQHTDENSCK